MIACVLKKSEIDVDASQQAKGVSACTNTLPSSSTYVFIFDSELERARCPSSRVQACNILVDIIGTAAICSAVLARGTRTYSALNMSTA